MSDPRLTYTHFNTVILGKIGSGKSSIHSVLTNPLHAPDDGDGYYFLDPVFDHANLRKDQQGVVTFIDTNGLVGDDRRDFDYLYELNANFQRMHYRVTSVIFCMRFGRVKPVDISVLQSVLFFMDVCHAENLVIVVSGAVKEDKQIVDQLLAVRSSLRRALWIWLDLKYSEERDEYGGRYIQQSGVLHVARNLIFREVMGELS